MPLPKIETPKYTFQIPSNGQKYTYRPYLVAEQKILMIAMESEDQTQIIQAIKDVIRACTNNTLDPETLSVFDLEYVFLKLRSKSTGEISKVALKCEKCEAQNPVEINLDKIGLNVSTLPSTNIKLTDKIGVIMRWPKISQANAASEARNSEGAAKAFFDLIVSCIESVYDDKGTYRADDQTPAEMNSFLESLNPQQFAKIQGFLESMPRLEHTSKFTCVKCSAENAVVIHGLANFFG